MAQEQPLLGAGDAHVGQAALLLHQLVVVGRARQREDVFLHARQEHVVEFQTLGRVQRHQRHAAAALIETVRVGHQSDVLQKIRKSALGIEPFEFGHSALQLADVLDAHGVFVALDGLQRAHIARLVDHEFEEFRRGLFVERLGKVDHQLGELADELLRPGGKGRVFHVQYRGHQRHFGA